MKINSITSSLSFGRGKASVNIPEGPSGGAEQDWLDRISGTDVVWYHSFDTASEVNQFRWTSGYGSDPNSSGADGEYVTWQSTGGADGGPYMKMEYPTGVHGGGLWWRPFAALNSASTGRGNADPAANGTITTQAWPMSDSYDTPLNWGNDSGNAGWYGSATDAAATPSEYQGTDFYLQVRVKRPEAIGAPPDGSVYDQITGKSIWFTSMNDSFNAGELVTYGHSYGNGDVNGVQPNHNVYSGNDFDSIGSQSGVTVTISNIDGSGEWTYSGGWDTLLYHITPGTNGGTGANRTKVEVWAQHDLTMYPAEAGLYEKIWDVFYPQGFSTGENSAGSDYYPGWNGLILAIYHNGSIIPSDKQFTFSYDQVIFSKATIAAPNF
jgi:hypothetical protein